MALLIDKNPGSRAPSGKRRAAAVRAPRSVAPAVRAAIVASLDPLLRNVAGLEEWLANEAAPEEAAGTLRKIEEAWRGAYGAAANNLADKWVETLGREGKKRLEKNLAASLAVNMTAIFEERAAQEAAELMRLETSAMLAKISEDYFADLQRAVMRNFQQLPQPEGRSLVEQIRHLSGVPAQRAASIARDQTAKINVAVHAARAKSIGVMEYVWRTARDRRVAGNPSGLFPEGNMTHGNHFEREGKIFRWDSPPHDGHPGWAVNCRCWAQDIIDMDKLGVAS